MKHIIFIKAWFFPTVLLILLYPAVSLAELKVGVIYTGNIPYYRKMHYAFARELIKKVPGRQKVKFIRQRPFPDPIAWSNAARKLFVQDIDLLVTYGFPATNAALSRRSKVPIVYVGVYNPDTTLEKSKGKATGCGYNLSMPTLLDNLTQTMSIKRLHVVYSHNEDDTIGQMKEIEKLAEQQNIDLVQLNIGSDEDVMQLYDIKDGDALFITGSAYAHVKMDIIQSIAKAKKIPSMDIFPGSVEDGTLMSCYQDPEKMGEKAAEIAAKILSGIKPEKIEPVVLKGSDVIVNAKEAKRLECTIPDHLVSIATKVIN